MKNGVQFKIKGLNQEKNLNILSKTFSLHDIVRLSKNMATFKVSLLHAKKVRKKLKDLSVEILEERRLGIFPVLARIFHPCIISAVIFSLLLILAQSPFILQYEVIGEESLSKSEIVSFVKDNFSSNKYKLSTKSVQTALYKEYEEISFVSVIVRGQTLVINIKEKLLPDEIYGDFTPIVSEYDGKITEINLISGSMAVKVGDYVRAGDVLVNPYYMDGDVRREVRANAEIKMEVYHTVSLTHYEDRTERVRTGRSVENVEISLFDLPIYTTINEVDYELFEEVVKESDLILNNLLPLKMRQTTYYELEEVEVHETFAEAQNRLIQEAREKILENAENCDIILNEHFTLEDGEGCTTMTYTIVEEKTIGGLDEN